MSPAFLLQSLLRLSMTANVAPPAWASRRMSLRALMVDVHKHGWWILSGDAFVSGEPRAESRFKVVGREGRGKIGTMIKPLLRLSSPMYSHARSTFYEHNQSKLVFVNQTNWYSSCSYAGGSRARKKARKSGKEPSKLLQKETSTLLLNAIIPVVNLPEDKQNTAVCCRPFSYVTPPDVPQLPKGVDRGPERMGESMVYPNTSHRLSKGLATSHKERAKTTPPPTPFRLIFRGYSPTQREEGW